MIFAGIFRRQTFRALKKKKPQTQKINHEKAQSDTESYVFQQNLGNCVCVCVGLAMKRSCGPCRAALCHPDGQGFCVRAPGSCLAVSSDQTHPPGRRITQETFPCEDGAAEGRTSARGQRRCSGGRGEEGREGGGEEWGVVRAAAGGLCELLV